MTRSWLTRKLVDNKAALSRRGRRRRPGLEAVEARMMLSVYTYTTLNTPDMNAGVGGASGINDMGQVEQRPRARTPQFLRGSCSATAMSKHSTTQAQHSRMRKASMIRDKL